MSGLDPSAFELLRRLGVGVVLGWAALPLLLALARRGRHAAPASYYRLLVATLALATALLFAPLARGLLGVELLPIEPASEWAGSGSITFVAELVSPLVAASEASARIAQGLAVLAGLWSLLVAAGVVASLAGYARLRRTYLEAPAAPPRVQQHAARVAAELGIVAPEIRVADGLASAFTFGVLSPVIVLSRAACEMTDEHLDFVLRHELWHVVRADARSVLWIDLAQRCFIGHPCRRQLAAEIRLAREASVDAAAAGARPLEYARFLLSLAERVRWVGVATPSLVSMADTALERRVEMLVKASDRDARLQRRSARRGLASLGLSGLVLGALVLLAPSSCGGQGAGAAAETTIVSGALSPEQIQDALYHAHPGPALACYDRLPQPRAPLEVRLKFEIGEDGRVRSGQANATGHPELDTCLTNALLGVVFPAPASGTVQVEMLSQLTAPLQERQARAAADEGISERIPRHVINEVVRGNFDRFRSCYELEPEPRPTTTVTLDFTIGRDGKVVDGAATDEGQPRLAACFDTVMRGMVFPAPEDGIVTVTYPVMVAPDAPDAP